MQCHQQARTDRAYSPCGGPVEQTYNDCGSPRSVQGGMHTFSRCPLIRPPSSTIKLNFVCSPQGPVRRLDPKRLPSHRMCSSSTNADKKKNGLENALDFLDGRINYERDRAVLYRERDLKLERMREFLAKLGDPQQQLPIVHIAGTKGKGSTAAMIGAILSAADYRTGVFTSPHLDRIEERVAIDGQPCSPDELVELVDRVRPVVEEMDEESGSESEDDYGPTYFEIIAAMALLHFAQRGVDMVILEVGLGGRLDATNVCSPRVCAITSIGFDHTRLLGNTLESIAAEKAGIVKSGVPLVSGVTDSGPRDVIREICQERGSPLSELCVDFDFQYHPPRHLDQDSALARFDFESSEKYPQSKLKDLPLCLLGYHQAANAAVALAVLGELEELGWKISEQAVRTGLANVDWPARVEPLSRRPTIVLDTAHNSSSVDALVRVLNESFSAKHRLLVFSASIGKDIRSMLECLLGAFDEVILTQYLNNPRAVPADKLAATAQKLGYNHCHVSPGPAEAWDQVQSLATPDDLICVTGSVFIAAEMRELILACPKSSPAELPLEQ